jgi:hypothetical protein
MIDFFKQLYKGILDLIYFLFHRWFMPEPEDIDDEYASQEID